MGGGDEKNGVKWDSIVKYLKEHFDELLMFLKQMMKKSRKCRK